MERTTVADPGEIGRRSASNTGMNRSLMFMVSRGTLWTGLWIEISFF